MKQKLTLLNIVRIDKLTVPHLQKKFPHSMQSGFHYHSPITILSDANTLNITAHFFNVHVNSLVQEFDPRRNSQNPRFKLQNLIFRVNYYKKISKI